MALTESTMGLPLGSQAPNFRLPDTDGRMVSLRDFEGARALLVVFMCNHCPYVIHVKEGLAALGRDYMPRGVAMVGINSNDVENYPQDSPERMKEDKEKYGYPFPYLFDETQETAKAYKAACTPDFFLFDGQFRLVYRGQMDGSRPGSDVPVTGKDLRAALDALLEGRPVPSEQRPSAGCNIKWKPGNEPDWL